MTYCKSTAVYPSWLVDKDMLDRFLTISERKKESGLAFIWNTHCHGGPSLPASSLTSLQTLDNGTLVFTIDYFHSSLFTYGIQSKPPKPWLGTHHFYPLQLLPLKNTSSPYPFCRLVRVCTDSHFGLIPLD